MAAESAVELCDIMDYFREGLSAPKVRLVYNTILRRCSTFYVVFPLCVQSSTSFSKFNNIAVLRPASVPESEHLRR